MSPLAKPESLPGSTQVLNSHLSLKKGVISLLPSPFSKDGLPVPLLLSCPLPPSTLTGLQEKWRVLLYILANCSPYAPISLGWGWGDGGVSKLYIELLTGAEALWFPWQPGWK